MPFHCFTFVYVYFSFTCPDLGLTDLQIDMNSQLFFLREESYYQEMKLGELRSTKPSSKFQDLPTLGRSASSSSRDPRLHTHIQSLPSVQVHHQGPRLLPCLS